MKKLCFAAAIVWLLFIWGNSMQTATQSSESSMQVLGFVAPLLEFLNIPPELRHNLVRKAAHMAEFGVLGLLWTGALTIGTDKKRSFLRCAAAFGICLCAAAIDESIQLFVPGRGAMLADVCIDAVGAAFGAAAVILLRGIRKCLTHEENGYDG